MSYQSLYVIVIDLGISVTEALRSSPSAITFCHELSPTEGNCWEELCGRLSMLALSAKTDVVSWKLDVY